MYLIIKRKNNASKDAVLKEIAALSGKNTLFSKNVVASHLRHSLVYHKVPE